MCEHAHTPEGALVCSFACVRISASAHARVQMYTFAWRQAGAGAGARASAKTHLTGRKLPAHACRRTPAGSCRARARALVRARLLALARCVSSALGIGVRVRSCAGVHGRSRSSAGASETHERMCARVRVQALARAQAYVFRTHVCLRADVSGVHTEFCSRVSSLVAQVLVQAPTLSIAPPDAVVEAKVFWIDLGVPIDGRGHWRRYI